MNNKELISQYVDTGLRIPEYQFTKLPNWAKKTYMRKRLIASKDGMVDNGDVMLAAYELALLDRDYLDKYLNTRLNYGVHIEDYEFNFLSDDSKSSVSTTKAEKGHHINDNMFEYLSDDNKRRYINLRFEKGNPMSDIMLKYGGDEFIDKYIKKVVENEFNRIVPSLQQGGGSDGRQYPNWFGILSDDLRVKALEEIIKYNIQDDNVVDGLKYVQIEDKYYKRLGSNRKVWLMVQFERGGNLGIDAFNDLSNEQKIKYAESEYGDRGWAPTHIEPYLKNTNNEQ